MKKLIEKYYFYIIGALAGIANGMFGAGGGMIVVPLLTHAGFDQKKAQATSISITVFLSVISLFVYTLKQSFSLYDALKYVPMGLLGAGAGALILKKISPKYLRIVFAFILIISGVRLIIR